MGSHFAFGSNQIAEDTGFAKPYRQHTSKDNGQASYYQHLCNAERPMKITPKTTMDPKSSQNATT